MVRRTCHAHKSYLLDREAKSISKNLWTDDPIPLAARLFEPYKALVGELAFRSRILHDNHWHGRNRAKARDAEGPDVICPLCTDQDSKRHLIHKCARPELQYIRNTILHEIRTCCDGRKREKN